jgi:hypothetical protein
MAEIKKAAAPQKPATPKVNAPANVNTSDFIDIDKHTLAALPYEVKPGQQPYDSKIEAQKKKDAEAAQKALQAKIDKGIKECVAKEKAKFVAQKPAAAPKGKPVPNIASKAPVKKSTVVSVTKVPSKPPVVTKN